MTEKVEITKRPPDLYGIGFCAREVNRDVGTTRGYVHRLYAAGAPPAERKCSLFFVRAPTRNRSFAVRLG